MTPPATHPAPPESAHATTLPATQPATRPARRSATRPATKPAEGPNIVLLLADDMGPSLTGFEGGSAVKTPHLDELAAAGACFSRCYTPTPQDAAGQATLLTGKYPHAHGVTGEEGTLAPRADSFTERLWRTGYVCGLVGNLRIPDSDASDPGFGLTDFVASDDGQWMNARTWVDGKEGRTDQYLLDWQADQAIHFIDKHQGQAFFLWLCLRAPREPWEYPPGTDSLYPPAALGLPDTLKIDPNLRPAKLKNAPLASQFIAHERALAEDRSRYYAMITRMDENIGRVLDRLDALNLREKTVVVFACGNGLALGDHRLYGKGPAFYEELVRGPMLLRYPNVAEPGTKINRVVGLVDLAPTLLDLAGHTPPMTMQGRSLVPLLREPAWQGHADEEFFEFDSPTPPKGSPAPAAPTPIARGVVTRYYKFVDYLDGSSALFDLRRDPNELDDIGAILDNRAHPRNGEYARNYSSVQKVLRDRLTLWRKQTKDPTLK